MSRSGRSLERLFDAWGELCAADHGQKASIIDRHLPLLGITSHQQFYRLAERHGLYARKRHAAPHSSDQYPDREEWAGIVATIKHSAPRGEGCLVTEIAVRIALENHHLPAAAARVPRATWDRWMREFGLRQVAKKVVRIRAERPNQAWYMDASRSAHFAWVKRLPDGDHLLRLQPTAHGPYKNKPEREARLRVWAYTIVDDASSYRMTRYCVATGENPLDALHVLDWAMSRADRRTLVMHGRPENMILDNGPVRKRREFIDACNRCGIGLIKREAYNSRAGGRVERTFSTQWQRFEKSFWPAVAVGETLTIRLSDLNIAMDAYCAEVNGWAHPTEKAISRQDAWLAIRETGVWQMAPGAIRSGFVQIAKHIGMDGTFRHKNRIWEVVGAYDCDGHIFEDMFGQLSFRSEDGFGYLVREFAEYPLGTYHAQANTPLENLKLELAPATGSIYQQGAAETNLVSLPPRKAGTVTPTLPVPAPGAFPSLEVGVAYLIQRLGGAAWRSLDQEIRNGLKAVLAQDLTLNCVEAIVARLQQAQAAAGGNV